MVRNLLHVYILAIKSEYWKFEYFTIFSYRTLLPVMISMYWNCSTPSNNLYLPFQYFYRHRIIFFLHIQSYHCTFFFLHTQSYHCTFFFSTHNSITVQIFSPHTILSQYNFFPVQAFKIYVNIPVPLTILSKGYNSNLNRNGSTSEIQGNIICTYI